MSDRLELTIARLRYSLGGDRPSQTARQAGSQSHPGTWLDIEKSKGGISRMAPLRLAPKLHSLPPILHILFPMPQPSCSKGARGLSV